MSSSPSYQTTSSDIAMVTTVFIQMNWGSSHIQVLIATCHVAPPDKLWGNWSRDWFAPTIFRRRYKNPPALPALRRVTALEEQWLKLKRTWIHTDFALWILIYVQMAKVKYWMVKNGNPSSFDSWIFMDYDLQDFFRVHNPPMTKKTDFSASLLARW